MATEEDKNRPTSKVSNGGPGRKKYSALKRMFRDGYLSVCVYKNAYEFKTFYDIVIYRKVRSSNSGQGYEYRRGASLKPHDLPVLEKLMMDVKDFLGTLGVDSEISTR